MGREDDDRAMGPEDFRGEDYPTDGSLPMPRTPDARAPDGDASAVNLAALLTAKTAEVAPKRGVLLGQFAESIRTVSASLARYAESFDGSAEVFWTKSSEPLAMAYFLLWLWGSEKTGAAPAGAVTTGLLSLKVGSETMPEVVLREGARVLRQSVRLADDATMTERQKKAIRDGLLQAIASMLSEDTAIHTANAIRDIVTWSDVQANARATAARKRG